MGWFIERFQENLRLQDKSKFVCSNIDFLWFFKHCGDWLFKIWELTVFLLIFSSAFSLWGWLWPSPCRPSTMRVFLPASLPIKSRREKLKNHRTSRDCLGCSFSRHSCCWLAEWCAILFYISLSFISSHSVLVRLIRWYFLFNIIFSKTKTLIRRIEYICINYLEEMSLSSTLGF